jgi:hypothetical protein
MLLAQRSIAGAVKDAAGTVVGGVTLYRAASAQFLRPQSAQLGGFSNSAADRLFNRFRG